WWWGKRFAEVADQVAQMAPEAISRLCEDLRTSGDHNTRLAAAQSLGHLGHVAPAILQALWSGLGDPGWGVREASVDALLRLNRRVSEMRPVLEEQRPGGASWASGLQALLGHESASWAPQLGEGADPA